MLGVFALHMWLETHSTSDFAIHKPEVAEICIETKPQIKFVSASLLLNDKTTLQELTSYSLKIGPRYKEVNTLFSAKLLKFRHFPRQA